LRVSARRLSRAARAASAAPRGAQDPEKEKEVQGLLGELPSDKFANLVAVGKLITDFSVDAPGDGEGEPGAGADALDDDIGVAVEFEGEDEEDDADEEVDEVVVRAEGRPTCMPRALVYIPVDMCHACIYVRCNSQQRTKGSCVRLLARVADVRSGWCVTHIRGR
jgi:hypothetical protein